MGADRNSLADPPDPLVALNAKIASADVVFARAHTHMSVTYLCTCFANVYARGYMHGYTATVLMVCVRHVTCWGGHVGNCTVAVESFNLLLFLVVLLCNWWWWKQRWLV